eukprot:3041823-Pyramimonas_sp.AAC.1
MMSLMICLAAIVQSGAIAVWDGPVRRRSLLRGLRHVSRGAKMRARQRGERRDGVARAFPRGGSRSLA